MQVGDYSWQQESDFLQLKIGDNFVSYNPYAFDAN